jgi:hypothetical protein
VSPAVLLVQPADVVKQQTDVDKQLLHVVKQQTDVDKQRVQFRPTTPMHLQQVHRTVSTVIVFVIQEHTTT